MSDELEAARADVERLEREVERLRRRLDDERFAEDLRDSVTLAAEVRSLPSVS